MCLSYLRWPYGTNTKALREDITELVGMFYFLFDLKQAGVRLTPPNHAMYPRFHHGDSESERHSEITANYYFKCEQLNKLSSRD